MTTNNSHALDRGIALLFHTAHYRPIASDVIRSVRHHVAWE